MQATSDSPRVADGGADLKARADAAMAAGDVRTARALLEEAVLAPPGHPDIWMSLAACRRALGDVELAMAAVDQALALEPRHFLGLMMRASLLERAGLQRQAAIAYGVALTQAPPDDRLDPATARATAHARDVHRRHLAEMEVALKDSIAGADGSGARRAADFVDRIVGKRKVFHQEPVKFHYPGLAAIEFHDRADFPWLAQLEAATEDIRRELEAILAEDGDNLAPYVNYPDGVPLDQWAELNRSSRWGAFHLFFDGRPVTWNADRAPKTMAAMSHAPQPWISGHSPAAMFSVLEPRTRIPPHTGVTNTRLVVHLPLIVPGGCGFRVGSETRPWREGEAWVFDDTIEHEAWNDSDERRTILIFDVWNPALSPEERQLIASVIEAADRFSAGEAGSFNL